MYLSATPSTKVLRGRLSPGRAGTVQTLRLMEALAERGARDLRVRELAINLARSAGVRPHDFLGEIAAQYQFVRDRVRFTRDPVGIELLQDPSATLGNLAGDCDDKATLLAALLKSIGHPARLSFRVIGLDPREPATFGHVYVVARMGAHEIALDPTHAGTPLGWQYPGPVSRGDFPLWAT